MPSSTTSRQPTLSIVIIVFDILSLSRKTLRLVFGIKQIESLFQLLLLFISHEVFSI